ncbi:MAG: minor capsid protein [Armatimonadetes bacterium]|nr:minor capsid protein [Armatimonadota bacterium]
MVRKHAAQLVALNAQDAADGSTDREIGRSIARLDIGLSRAHANTWARTESTRFYTLGRVQQAEVAGDYVWGYEYVVIEDTHTTDICRGFIGKRVSKEQATRFPPSHYNCRTTMKSVLRSDLTGQPEQPPGTELDPDAEPAEGFGADPRGPIRRTDPERRTPPKPVREASPTRLPDEEVPPRQTHQGGPRALRKQERAVDEAHAAWVKAGSPRNGPEYDRFAAAWQQLAQRRQQMIRRSAVNLTPRDEARAAARIRKTLTRLQRQQVEHGVIFDRRGRVLWQGTSSQRYQIRFPGDDLPGGSPAEQWEGAIFAHNHPPVLGTAAAQEAAGFGDADLFGLAIRRAHASHVVYSWQGRWYQQEVGPPAGGWRDADPRVLQDLLAEANVRSQRREADLIQRNERLSADEAHYDHWHEALMELRNSGLISYDRTVLVE